MPHVSPICKVLLYKGVTAKVLVSEQQPQNCLSTILFKYCLTQVVGNVDSHKLKIQIPYSSKSPPTHLC